MKYFLWFTGKHAAAVVTLAHQHSTVLSRRLWLRKRAAVDIHHGPIGSQLDGHY